VAVSVDGRPPVATQAFSERSDVRRALNEAAPAGWRIPFSTVGLAPGEHHVTAFVWASQKGEPYYLEERNLTVRPAGEDLADASKVAAARLRAHQQGPGYWLTAYTAETRFEKPRQEMNTFLTSLLVDLLDPLAATGGLDDVVQRARQHLTGQIEAGGLVRYHGLPNAPGIGTLGCAITPDADDTALVWRLAPDSDRRRLPAALATLDRYRTSEGLYRTWLAPREAYQCLDPGSDPDPADIAIQMHVLLLLAEAQPPASRALCEALRPVVDQDRIWVYYRKTPLVPILRLADLQRAGCTLELPESRMRTLVPGQEIWVSLVQLLRHARTPGGPAPEVAAIQAVLRQILLVGGRRLRALAQARLRAFAPPGSSCERLKLPRFRRPSRREAGSASAFAVIWLACVCKRSSFSRALPCSAPYSRSATRGLGDGKRWRSSPPPTSC
jgi:hypothetical protein